MIIRQAFNAVNIGVHDLLISLETEDEGHVDIACLANHAGDRRYALVSCRDLNHDIRTRNLDMQVTRARQGVGLIMGECGVYLNAHKTVEPLRRFVERRKNIKRAMDVFEHQLPIAFDWRKILFSERFELRRIVV